MGIILKVFLLLFTVGTAYIYYELTKIEPVPIVEDEYWGPQYEQWRKEDASIRPFKIDIPAPVLDDLKARLKREIDSADRLPPPLEGIGFEYGFNSRYLKAIGQHWLTRYDWRKREQLLNKFPQFKTKIGGLDIHFYHVKPANKNGKAPRPILLLHGWPGSIVEFQKIIPLLSEPKNSQYNYELVVPSLPGFGFSDASSRRGMSHTEMGNIFKRLMERLGHKKFFVMGGDWGATITSDMATVYPTSIIAAQSNACGNDFPKMIGIIRYIMATWFPDTFMSSSNEKESVLPFSHYLSFMIREMGYAHIQGTKPDTVGVGSTHSPLGLAAYILEKFSTWTNRSWMNREDGGILEKFKLDELLDNVMVYWVSSSGTSSMRIYAEAMDPAKKHIADKVPTNVPFSCQFMKGEIAVLPQYALIDKYTNIKRYSVASRGGHFAAFEEPELVAEDAISHFENFEI